VFHCNSGNRTRQAAERLVAVGFEQTYELEGGLVAWKQAGLPVVVDRRAPLPIMRQVQIAAGSLVLLGVILAVLVSPWFMALSAFVGAGLVMAGITGFCGMANLLAHMPWNRRPQGAGPRDADRLAPAR
jgi:rhodanese-related sulfurtransferase